MSPPPGGGGSGGAGSSTAPSLTASAPNLQFVVHPLPGSQEQLFDKLKESADRLNKSGSSAAAAAPPSGPFLVPPPPYYGQNALNSLGGVAQIEVGPSHFAFLTQEGRICRLPFSVISDRLDLSQNSDGSSSGGGGGSGGSGGPPSGGSGGGGGGVCPSGSSKYKPPSHSSSAAAGN